MLVSIITPTYNSVHFLSAMIDSILLQTHEEWELIITDDFSNDGTGELLKRYVKYDSRIKVYYFNENQGAGAARNNSIEKAKGRFIAFCDSDDLWKPEKLEKQINFMLNNDLALSFSDYDLINQNGYKLGTVRAPKQVSYSLMLRNNYIGCLTAMYDVSKLGKVYMISLRKRQDWALWLTILKKTEYAVSINESLASYRIRNDSVSSNKIALIKYTWQIYRRVELFSAAYSFFLLSQFIFYYFKKKLSNE